MAQLEDWLSGGDLRSDGASNEVAEFVKSSPRLLPDLIAALRSSDPVVRGRAADALEKVARALPDPTALHIGSILSALAEDPVPMVRWHLAMTLGHLSMFEDQANRIEAALLKALDDPSVFVKTWAIASLCLVAVQYPERRRGIVNSIARLKGDRSAAVRTRVAKALAALTGPEPEIPEGWIKSDHLQGLSGRGEEVE